MRDVVVGLTWERLLLCLAYFPLSKQICVRLKRETFNSLLSPYVETDHLRSLKSVKISERARTADLRRAFFRTYLEFGNQVVIEPSTPR